MVNRFTKSSEHSKTPSTLSLGLSFLFTGTGFGLPILLYPLSLSRQLQRPPDVLNLFCLVAWMGLSHFVFAYRGHGKALRKSGGELKYIIVFTLMGAVLFSLRAYLGITLFSALAWIYFISHLSRAEMYFSSEKDWRIFLLPLLAFTYFSYVLLAPSEWVSPLPVFLFAALCFTPMVSSSMRRKFQDPFSKPLLLIAMFLIGEALLWARYRPYMSGGFRDGVYTVHVALASFYHYFKSYAHMLQRKHGGILQIALVNILVIALAIGVVFYFSASPAIYILGPQYFTVWVWLHQAMSDYFNGVKMSS